MGIKIEDLPLRLQAQVREQLAAERNPPSFAEALEGKEIRTPEMECGTIGARRRGPNKTELDYQRRHLRGMDARYEALTFRMANGHRYTPDWVVFVDGKPVACHECKGGYALHSQQRARLAFDQARVEFPGLCWVWAVCRQERIQKSVFRSQNAAEGKEE
jgi:hypothetical protein